MELLKNHPYIPNADPGVQRAMLAAAGLPSLDALHADIPGDLRLDRALHLPVRIDSEYALERHMAALLNQNTDCSEALSFLGAGCYQHHVPAVCDEIAARSEFRTAYAGEPYEDHGRFQALFEYQSLMAELLDAEVVNVPAIDGAQAAATAICMASRMTGRHRALISADIHPDKKGIMENYCKASVTLEYVPFDAETGQPDVGAFFDRLDTDVCCVYLESPSFLGVVPDRFEEIALAAHKVKAEVVAGCEPSLLGVLESPMNRGADIVTGDIQSLGNHMNGGGGLGGFIATRDEMRYVREYPSRLFGLTRTSVPGEYGFGDVYYDRTSFAHREGGKEYVGTQAALCGIVAGVYLALAGPEGIRRLGERMLLSTRYLAKGLESIPGVCVKFPAFAHELVADFSKASLPLERVLSALEQKRIFAGFPLGGAFPAMPNALLMCCTEIQEKADIDRLIAAIKEEMGV